MRYWIIKLTLFIGSYEKNVTHAIGATSGSYAELEALRDESHNADAGWIKGESGDWEDDDMIYRVHTLKEISHGDYLKYQDIIR